MQSGSWSWRKQLVGYVFIAVAAIGLTAIMIPTSGVFFERFSGRINPVLVISLASGLGGLALWWLRKSAGFAIIDGGKTVRGILIATGFATLFAMLIIVVDILLRYPQDMNVPFPHALGFYPAVGFVAEILFHVLPVTIMLLIFMPFRERIGRDRMVWLAIIIAAGVEPTFHVLFSDESLISLDVYTWFHVYAFAFIQLFTFKRYDFISMYSLRLVYYAYWHIVWGIIRLELLF